MVGDMLSTFLYLKSPCYLPARLRDDYLILVFTILFHGVGWLVGWWRTDKLFR